VGLLDFKISSRRLYEGDIWKETKHCGERPVGRLCAMLNEETQWLSPAFGETGGGRVLKETITEARP
jgi:hypothetical protein